MKFTFKPLVLIILIVLSNVVCAQSNDASQSTNENTQESVESLDGLVPKFGLLIEKIEQLEREVGLLNKKSISCRIATGSPTASANWDNNSFAQCHEDEFLTGGGCEATAAGGRVSKLNNKNIYQCSVDHGATATPQAICCKYQ